MIYDCIMKIGGKVYAAGEDAPDIKEGGALAPSSSFVENEPLPFTETAPQVSYTKTEINRMSTEDLRRLAGENGVDGAEGISGADLKKILIEKFGL